MNAQIQTIRWHTLSEPDLQRQLESWDEETRKQAEAERERRKVRSGQGRTEKLSMREVEV